MMRSYRNLPEIMTGYVLDNQFSVIVPVARTNLITNPSFETNTTSWTAIGGSIARSTTYQYHGAYSLAITPTSATTDGARYDTVSLTSGTIYAYSAKVRGVAGLKYKLAIETTGAVELTSVTFTATGRWQWIYGYYTETSSTTRRVTVRKASHASTTPFYLDGVQVEAIAAGESVSTYIDGDQQGLLPNQQPPAYLWTGAPHASTSSRSGLTRAGGMVVPMKKYLFLITAIIGLGLATPQNNATEYAQMDGGYPDFTRKPVRQFSLAGAFQARTYAQLRDLRGGLAALLDRDLVGLDQPLMLRHYVEDSRGNIISDAALIPAKYAGGLSGNTDNHYAEQAAISFTQYVPFVRAEGEAGTALSVRQSVSNTGQIIFRTATGTWQSIGTGPAGGTSISALLFYGGKLYIGGSFTSFNGVANTANIAVYDVASGTVSALGTGGPGGVTDDVFAIVAAPNGNIIVGGNFANMGGVAAADNIARWDGSAWNGLSTGANNIVSGLAYGQDGTLYVGGTFTTIGGVAASRIAKWNGSAFSAMGTGAAGGNVSAVAVGNDGYVYAGGSFTQMGGVANTAHVARWSIAGAAWSAMSGGAPSATVVAAFAVGLNGLLYAGGDFFTEGSSTWAHLAAWNGTAWSPVLSTTSLSGGEIGQNAMTTLRNGGILMGGNFTTANGITLSDGIVIWNGATFIPLEADLPSTAVVRAVAQNIDGALAIAYLNTGGGTTSVTAATTTITNAGTVVAYPTLNISGPSSGTSRIYQMINYTTGRAIYLNYTINAGETATLRFEPDNLSFESTFQGNLASKILGGSSESDFFLQPGANIISFYAADSTVTATLQWRPQFASLDDVP